MSPMTAIISETRALPRNARPGRLLPSSAYAPTFPLECGLPDYGTMGGVGDLDHLACSFDGPVLAGDLPTYGVVRVRLEVF